MRITLVAEAFYPAVDGGTRTVKAVADHLVDTGHEVSFLAPGPGLASYRGCPVVRTGSTRRRHGQRVGAALADLAPDLVHAVAPGPLGRCAREEADRAGIPVVALPPGAWTPGVDTAAFHPGLRDPWLHASWSRARSRSGAGVIGGSVIGRRVVVGFAGRLEARHGVRRLADLAGLPGIRPVIIGEGPLKGWLRSRLPGARFTGALDTGHLAIALASLDVLVHPGEQDDCCQSLREAAASGVPVVAPRSGAARPVRSLETGLLYDQATGAGLREAVASITADPQRSLLGARARELVLARDWPTAVEELVEQHYRPAIDGSGRLASLR